MFVPHVKKLIAPEVLLRFEDVKRAVEEIPEVELPSGRLLSCHMVCRVLSRKTGLEYRDGYFGFCIEHSWLVYSRYIIDAYPVGALDVPILFETGYMLPWKELYREKGLSVVGTEEFQCDVNYLYSVLGMSEKLRV